LYDGDTRTSNYTGLATIGGTQQPRGCAQNLCCGCRRFPSGRSRHTASRRPGCIRQLSCPNVRPDPAPLLFRTSTCCPDERRLPHEAPVNNPVQTSFRVPIRTLSCFLIAPPR